MKRYVAVVGTVVICLTLAASAAFSGSKDKKNSRAVGPSVKEEKGTKNPAASDTPDSQKKESSASMEGDTRPDRLRLVTGGWSTDWNRRTIEYHELLSGGPPRDGIPSIDNPIFITPDEAASWLKDKEPVIAFSKNRDARAYPLQILIWHEIVNDKVADIPILVTFCPLCNSSIVFDRRISGRIYSFGTSGLLRNSDLVMYDRKTESLWQQLTGEGIVGVHAGDRLGFLPSSLVSFGEFRTQYPRGKILSRETGFSRPYGENPYVGYDRIDQSPFLFSGEVDKRLHAMERVVAVSLELSDDTTVDIAYPYSVLSKKGVINEKRGETAFAVFFKQGTASALDSRSIAEGTDVGSANVFSSSLAGRTLTFLKKDDGTFSDRETGSVWNIFGKATEGPLSGKSLVPIVHGNHFWFAWAAFKPNTIIYEGSRAELRPAK